MAPQTPDKKKPSKRQPPTAAEPAAAGPPPALRIVGAVLLVVAVAMSVMLGLEHAIGLALPGCGPGSGCAEAAKSVWATVPLIGWPVAHLGLAYFLALLVLWLASPHGLPPAIRNLVRFGVLISIGFIVVMIVEKHVCQYCVAVHVANVAFWIVMECTRSGAGRAIGALVRLGGVFVLATAVLAVIEYSVRAQITAHQEQELAESTAEIIAATERAQAAATQQVIEPVAAAATQPAERPAGTATTRQSVTSQPAAPPMAASAPTTGVTAEETADSFKQGFRGRYLLGPEQAAVRVVMFTDYQCPDCRRIEYEVRQLVQQHDNISLSVKLFPFDQSCNSTAHRTLHPNACWAARAAEAAGILWGNDGFWAMHEWLFKVKGTFQTTEELEAGIRSIGQDPQGFVQVMTSAETLKRIKGDIEEARLLGLWQTPLVFINGVELRGWNVPNAATRAVNAVLATNPTPQTHAHDQPPLAVEKCIGDWRAQPEQRIPADQSCWPLGPEDGRVKVVIFGDYQLDVMLEADTIIREWIDSHGDTQYIFRHFPFELECNPHVPSTRHEGACRASRAAEAAGQLGGSAGFWGMHSWLLNHQEPLTDEDVRQAADELGLDADALLAALEQPAIAAGIREDVDAGKRVGLRSIPLIFINNRSVVRWHWMGSEKGREILEGILSAAAADEP